MWVGLHPVWTGLESPKFHVHVYGGTPPDIVVVKLVSPAIVCVGAKSATIGVPEVVTISVKLAVWLPTPPVQLTLIVYVPVGVEDVVEIMTA